MRILLNSLATIQGGQITRTEEFLARFEQLSSSNDVLIVLARKGSHKGFSSKVGHRVVIIEIKFLPFMPPWLYRIIWENIAQPSLTRVLCIDVYLTFSHSLPLVDLKVPTLVGVSNLAPFSKLALESETLSGKIRLKILRRTIIDAAMRSMSVIALSEKCKAVLIEHNVPSKKIQVIYNGVNHHHQFTYNSEQFRHDGKEDYILYVSNFYRYKNFQQLIVAYGCLPFSVRQRYKLKLVGKFSDRQYVSELMNLSTSLACEQNIEFCEEIDRSELYSCYSRAALFVFPSLVENCPNILLEALASGCPILSINEPPMPEFCGKAAKYFAVSEREELALKMLNILTNTGIAQAMRENALALSRGYSWDYFTRDTIAQCRAVLGVRSEAIGN